jgi:hypothetical protein
MPATYVTVAELRTNLGIGTLYTDAVVESVCQSAEDIIKSKLWFNRTNVIAHEATDTTGTLYFDTAVSDRFYVGQTITVENVAPHFNGSQTITALTAYSLSFVKAQITTVEKHTVVPYGTIVVAGQVDYSTIPAVRQAAMMIAVDIWQARQMSATGGISPDFQPSPYRMGNTLMARVRGLLADYLDPGGLVG